MEIRDLEYKSIQYRKSVISMIKNARAGHTGGSLSCLDIVNVLYNHVMNVSPLNFQDPNRDRYIHSKGHSVETLYAVLADKGFFPPQELETLCRYQSHFVGHPTRKVPGIEHNTGGLGHGLSVAVGLALAAQKDSRPLRVFAVMGDGEVNEGSVWEAAMSAAHFKLDNLVAVVDRNTLQISGRTEAVMSLEPLEEKFRAFGFEVRSVDGNSIPELVKIFSQIPFVKGKPSLVLAHTVKGKGISYVEDRADWHHHVPTDEEFTQAMQELHAAEEEWKKQYARQ